ncbi:hypothetical protein BH24ACT15_BH24ACT15_37950 [soil metagenome]
MTSGLGRPVGSPQPPPLDVLSRRLRADRAAVQLLRPGPAGSPRMASARRCLLVALEDYVTALETRGLPVPHTLQRELRLHRELFD